MGGLISYISTSVFHQTNTKPDLRSNVPLPSTIHAIIQPSIIKNRALFIVGDVHGCYDEMRELLEKAKNATPKEMTVVFVGDLVNKGPKNKQVLDYVQESGAYSVRGNHDNAVLYQCLSYQSDTNYEVSARYEWICDLSQENIDYLRDLPYTIKIPSHNVIIVHAGLLPGKPLEHQNLSDMIVMRNVIDRDYFDGGPYASEIAGGSPWIRYWGGKDHIYFGHDAVRGLQQSTFATGLDTGCVYGGCLTGVFVNESGEIDSMLQVKAKDVYKPVS
ncbi:bis(5'-nucleosyl)-tetraphosphatase PrpE [asymmetrical]-like [Anneissia japonica]|uniref:bis(5'-nucleosyl)-tetraphosphatase PrpE [asymmetrical]-like n=1 Tax=Anneissia japonica TaxID=1529436 RepID=UPI0014258CD6|nr:bis(5'-nucleosyl)-tetraphosphatase PrpE [asymmetrical]-like [Anneissia japonica]